MKDIEQRAKELAKEHSTLRWGAYEDDKSHVSNQITLGDITWEHSDFTDNIRGVTHWMDIPNPPKIKP